MRQITTADRQHSLDRFVAVHREHGLPVTIQRRAVFEAILDREDHPTAEQVYQVVHQDLPQISRMTVHRILATFVSLGLAAKACHPGSAARFDPNIQQHHHLVCLDCGAIVDVEDPRLNDLPWPKVKPGEFRIEGYHVQFRGRCARCARPDRGDRPKAPRSSPARRSILHKTDTQQKEKTP